jgi:hypothetical protein
MRDPSGRATLTEIGVASFTAGLVGASVGAAGYGVKVWFGQPATLADATRAVLAGFFIGATGGALGAAGAATALTVAAVAVLNTTNTLFLIHRARDVSLQDVYIQTLLAGATGTIGAGAAATGASGAPKALYGVVVNTVGVSGSTNKLVSSGPADDLIVWRQQDRCPGTDWYEKDANGNYKVQNADPFNLKGSNLAAGGCNLVTTVVNMYKFQFSGVYYPGY